MSELLLEQIKQAQAAKLDDYMVWAEIGDGPKANQIILHRPAAAVDQGRNGSGAHPRPGGRALTDCGYSPADIAAARLALAALPSAEEVSAELDAQLSAESEMILADLTMWEACRLRLHLSPRAVDHSDLEMEYKGLKIRRSAVG